MNKTLISTLVAFVIGFGASYFLFKPKPTKDLSAEQCTDLTKAKSDLISISQNEYLEYTQIKDMKQKYEKADEILGKIMLLFLADIGFRLQTENAVGPITESVSTTTQAAPNNNLSSLPETNSAVVENNSDLAGKSSLIKKLETEKQIRDALDQAIIDNPKIESAKGTMPSQKQIQILDGRYSGTIKFLDTKRENLNVTWDLSVDYSKTELSGSFHLSIEGPSKNSKSNGNGYIDSIIGLSGDQDGFLVNACGDDCYLQLYYNAPAGQFYGNYYESVKGLKGKFQRVGLVELRK